jgi:hypothetical protein
MLDEWRGDLDRTNRLTGRIGDKAMGQEARCLARIVERSSRREDGPDLV